MSNSLNNLNKLRHSSIEIKSIAFDILNKGYRGGESNENKAKEIDSLLSGRLSFDGMRFSSDIEDIFDFYAYVSNLSNDNDTK